MADRTAKKAVADAVPKGTKKAQYVLRLEHIEALRRESLRRAMERSEGGPDASEILREILDAWMAKPGKR